MKICGVYLISNKVNGRSYVGISLDIRNRWRAHRKPKPSSSTVLHSAIRKYGVEAFTFEVLEQCAPEILAERERYWIAALGTFPDGYNLTSGGESGRLIADSTKAKLSALNTGVKRGPCPPERAAAISAAKKGICTLSREQILAIAAARKGLKRRPESVARSVLARIGFKHSAETKKRMSEAQKGRQPWLGRKHSPESRARMSVAQKGRTFSLEALAKMSAARKGRAPWNKGKKLSTRTQLMAAS